MSEEWRTKKPDIFAGAPAFANGSEQIRQALALSMIRGRRTTGSGSSDEEEFAKLGFRDANEYWYGAVSEPMKALDFVFLLATHLLDPTTPVYLVNMSIEKALCLALKTETWFIKDPHSPERGAGDLDRLMLHPRAAAQWLLSLPKQKHLVPPGLRAFLEPSERREQVPRRSHGTQSAIRDAAHKLGKKRTQYRTFEEYRRALCKMADVDPKTRGWGEDSVRRALSGAECAASAES
jgi:hypothetical protein